MLRCSANLLSITTHAEAPSDNWLALPAVMKPPSRTGFNDDSPSRFVPGRLPSSFSSTTSSKVISFVSLFITPLFDGSGTISTKELLPVLRSIGQNPTEDEILNLVIEYDLNGDGTVDVTDIISLVLDWGGCSSSCLADLNGDGIVNVADLSYALQNWGNCG